MTQMSLSVWKIGQAEQRVYSALCDIGRATCNRISSHLMTKGIIMPPNNVNRRLRSLEKQGLVEIVDANPRQIWSTKNRIKVEGKI